MQKRILEKEKTKKKRKNLEAYCVIILALNAIELNPF